MAFVIGQPCIGVKDKACLPTCPVDCIHGGEKMLYIDPSECIDCGACMEACPVKAIFWDQEPPPQWAYFIAINAGFFPEHDEEKAWKGATD